MNTYYRIHINGKGIYDVLDEVDPQRQKRKTGPDDTWYPHISSSKYPNGDFWWTEKGLQKYKECGLYAFHENLIGEKLAVEKNTSPKKILYEDAYQVVIEK